MTDDVPGQFNLMQNKGARSIIITSANIRFLVGLADGCPREGSRSRSYGCAPDIPPGDPPDDSSCGSTGSRALRRRLAAGEGNGDERDPCNGGDL